MTQITITINQCQIEGNDECFTLNILMQKDQHEATNPELMMGGMLAEGARSLVRKWCDDMIKNGVAKYHVEIEGNADDPWFQDIKKKRRF